MQWSGKLPAWGTTSGGVLYEQVKPDYHTAVPGGLQLLPTPAASNPNDHEGVDTWLARQKKVEDKAKGWPKYSPPLSIALRLLPTPTTECSHESGKKRDWGGDLLGALAND